MWRGRSLVHGEDHLVLRLSAVLDDLTHDGPREIDGGGISLARGKEEERELEVGDNTKIKRQEN